MNLRGVKTQQAENQSTVFLLIKFHRLNSENCPVILRKSKATASQLSKRSKPLPYILVRPLTPETPLGYDFVLDLWLAFLPLRKFCPTSISGVSRVVSCECD